MDDILEKMKDVIIIQVSSSDCDIELVERLSKLYFELCALLPPKVIDMSPSITKQMLGKDWDRPGI